MKILYTVDLLTTYGGVEMHVLNLANEMSKKHKVTVYVNKITKYLKEMFNKDITIIVGFERENINKVCKMKFDAVHANPFTAFGIGSEIAEKSKAKLFLTIHGNYTVTIPPKTARNINKVICISESAMALNKANIPQNKGIVLYNPIDTNKFKTKIIKQKSLLSLINPDYKTIVIPSRMSDAKEKPMFQLLRILPDLVNRLGIGLNVLFVGSGTYKNDLEKAADKLDESKLNIRFIGEVADIYNYINLADLVLACDRAAIEALLCEKIVFYMGQNTFKALIENVNYKDLLFSQKGFKNYPDSELKLHLQWMLTQETLLKEKTNMLKEKLIKECGLSSVTKKLEELYSA